ncbi:MAG: hypothetical protein KC414_09430 [Romboutsia sp.]|nr:hypothetical protein [Romboutsia sp.]
MTSPKVDKNNNSVVVEDNTNTSDNQSSSIEYNADVPDYVITTLQYVEANHKAPDGYVGGRVFNNYEKLLPQRHADGSKTAYQEWDVHKKVNGQNRGAERLVTEAEGSAYYTKDHYKSFIQIK